MNLKSLFLLLNLFAISYSHEGMHDKFRQFVAKYNKTYSTHKEYWSRFDVFNSNYHIIEEKNRDKYNSYQLGINQFSDLTSYEFKQKHLSGLNYNPPKQIHFGQQCPLTPPPDSMDWRDHGLVTPIKDQGQCGSCWAFSAVATLEGQHAKKTGKLVSLSEQNLVDCSDGYGNQGCGGGWPSAGLEYIEYNNGLDTEDSYPYFAINKNCTFRNDSVGANVQMVVNITQDDEDFLVQAIGALGPISVAIDAQADFQSYKSGVYNSVTCSREWLDHAVTAVGYGELNGNPYYIIKNSWGIDWGMNGYMLFNRGNNTCGIAHAATYPVI